ncbi:25117_t:CDS:2, partial [Gigaspora margarita]
TVAKDSIFYASLRAPIVLENSQITKENVDLASEDIHKDKPTANGYEKAESLLDGKLAESIRSGAKIRVHSTKKT